MRTILNVEIEPFGPWLRLTGMGFGATESHYRRAFDEFAEKVRQARALLSASSADCHAIDAALLELEKARVNYNHQRDLLAQQLLSSSRLPDSNQPSANRVREIAELRWELAGKPEGSDEENWYRAEEIVRLAQAA
jgi:hypothetical protein